MATASQDIKAPTPTPSSSELFLCCDCLAYLPRDKMQVKPCSLCRQKKCIQLHGGEKMYSCKKCYSVDLCIDCITIGRCCSLSKENSLSASTEVMLFCYECQWKHPASKMQAIPCSLCHGRKCIDLHGGAAMSECLKCHSTDLCADCYCFEKCCENKKDPTKLPQVVFPLD